MYRCDCSWKESYKRVGRDHRMQVTMLLQVGLLVILLASSGGAYNITLSDNGKCLSAEEPCSTLETLAANHSITSNNSGENLTLLFLPGNYVVQNIIHLNFTSFRAISLSPNEIGSVITIECNAEMTITFRNVSIINIKFLEFCSCGGKGTRGDVIQFIGSITTMTVQILIQNSSFTGTKNGNSLTINARSVKLTIARSTFDGNHGYGINASNTVITANITETTFTDNYHRAISIYRAHENSAISITDCTFSSISEIAVYLNGRNPSVRMNYCSFHNNGADISSPMLGAIHMDFFGKNDNNITIMNSLFHSNTAGAIVHHGNTITIDNCTFTANTLGIATDNASSIYVGGAISSVQSSLEINRETIVVINSNFQDNSAFHGGAIFARNTMIHLCGNSIFSNNTAENGGAIFADNTNILFYNGHFNFIGNKAEFSGGAIIVHGSTIEITEGNVTFENNSAGSNGGALFLSRSLIYDYYWHMERDKTNFIRNRALHGGALYVKDSTYNCYDNKRVFVFLAFKFSLEKFFFSNNTAHRGTILYGTNSLSNCNHTYFKRFGSLNKTIASDAVKVCLCNDDRKPDCSLKQILAYKGESIAVNVITLTLCDNFSSSAISICEDSTLTLDECYRYIREPCEEIRLLTHSKQTSKDFILKTEGPCKEKNKLNLSISFKPCPPIFPLSPNGERCECDERLGTKKQKSVIQCNVSSQTIHKKKDSWFRYKNGKLEMCNHCPLGYCNQTVVVHISDHETSLNGSLCVNNRSGVICGMCEESFSVALGSSRCIDCSKKYDILWLVPLFAVMGLILVLSLLFLDVTVSIGLINGLIFYANILSISGWTNNYNCSIHPILSVFISWVNLDFGIETCFFSGMDMYQKTWLQFAFPLYIWLLVGLIIVLSHYSTRVMRLLGRKVIPVLATLFLLSYIKIFTIVITVFTFSEVLQGDADNRSDKLVPRKVWIHDGNIDYLRGKHAPLFLVALLFLVVLFLPYTLLLTFGQCLRSLPRRKGLTLLHSTAFISIMDAYHAPFNRKHRYWTGLLLLIRCFLLVVYIATYFKNNPIDTSIILIITMGLIILKASFKERVYQKFLMNILENIFLLNLGILAYYMKDEDTDELKNLDVCHHSLTVSISVALVTFFAIVACHIYFKIKGLGCNPLQRFIQKITAARRVKATQKTQSEDRQTVTTTIVELRESLLETVTDEK